MYVRLMNHFDCPTRPKRSIVLKKFQVLNDKYIEKIQAEIDKIKKYNFNVAYGSS